MKKGATKGKVQKGTSPYGKPNQPSCFRYLTGKCTKPSGECWHPSEFVKDRTNEGCQIDKMCVSSFSQERSTKDNVEKDPKSEKTILQLYAVIPNWVVYFRTSICQIGPKNVRRFLLKKSRKRFPRGHLELKHTKKLLKDSSTFGNNWDHFWESFRVGRNIIANPTRPYLWTEIQTIRCGQKMVPEKQEKEATFFKQKMERRVASSSTVNPDEKMFIVS